MLTMRTAVAQGLLYVTAKIGETNHASLQMFQGLGFQFSSNSKVFREVTLTCQLDGAQIGKLLQDTAAVMKPGRYAEGKPRYSLPDSHPEDH